MNKVLEIYVEWEERICDCCISDCFRKSCDYWYDDYGYIWDNGHCPYYKPRNEKIIGSTCKHEIRVSKCKARNMKNFEFNGETFNIGKQEIKPSKLIINGEKII